MRKAYPKYKPSGVEWLGDVPEHWGVKRLKFLLQEPLQYGANEAAEFDDPDLPRFIRITDINDQGGLRDETFKSLPEEVAKPFLLKEGDLLFARSGATVGKTFFYQISWGRAAYAGYLIRARLRHSDVIPNFVNLVTKTSFYQQWIQSMLIQATIQNVSAEKYADFVVPLPPLPEQHAIAAFLDRETGRIDALIAKKQRLLELLAEQRTALISRAVTMGLDASVKLKPSGVEWLGDVPEHWEVKKGRLIGILQSTPNVGEEEQTEEEGKIDYIKVEDLNTKGNMPVFQSSRLKCIELKRPFVKNALIFPKRGAAIFTNKVSIILHPGLLDPNMMGWQIDKKNDLKFYYYALTYRRLDDLADTSTVPQINNKHIYPEFFPAPPLSEQQAITAFLDHETAKIDVLSDKVTMVIEKLKEYRTALISSTVTGKIDVREAV